MRDLLDTALDTASSPDAGFRVYRLVNLGLLTAGNEKARHMAGLSIWWWAVGQHMGISPAATRFMVKPTAHRWPPRFPAAMQLGQLQW